MLDTNTVTTIIRGDSLLVRERFVTNKRDQAICISAITEGELLYGLRKNPRTKMRAPVKRFLAYVRTLPWGKVEADIYGTLRFQQEKSGRRLEPMDMLIAAHAISTNSILVSSDRAFRNVRGLPGLEDWAID